MSSFKQSLYLKKMKKKLLFKYMKKTIDMEDEQAIAVYNDINLKSMQ